MHPATAVAVAMGLLLARLCLAALLAGFAAAEERYIEDTDRFPGWKGELPNNPADQLTQALSQQATGKTVGFGENGKVRSLWSLLCWLVRLTKGRCTDFNLQA